MFRTLPESSAGRLGVQVGYAGVVKDAEAAGVSVEFIRLQLIISISEAKFIQPLNLGQYRAGSLDCFTGYCGSQCCLLSGAPGSLLCEL